jgi:hypothetical protein
MALLLMEVVKWLPSKMQHFKVLKMDATSYSESLYLSASVHGVASQKDVLKAGNHV